jgi:hypothetical protein
MSQANERKQINAASKSQRHTRLDAVESINWLRVPLTRSCPHKEGAGSGRDCSILEDHGVCCAQLHDEWTAPSDRNIIDAGTRNRTACQILDEVLRGFLCPNIGRFHREMPRCASILT